MKKLEKFLIAFSVVGFIFNIFTEGEGNISLLIGMSLLAFLYLIFGFALFNNIGFRDLFKRNSYTEINMRRIILSAVFGIAMFGIIIGILFRLLAFEGSFEILSVSLIIAIALYAVLLARFYYKRITIASYYRSVTYRLIPYGIIGSAIIIESVYQYYFAGSGA